MAIADLPLDVLRLFGIIEYLEKVGECSHQELAQRFQVSEDVIEQDLYIIFTANDTTVNLSSAMADFDMYEVDGEKYVRLIDAAGLRQVGLTFTEASALTAALMEWATTDAAKSLLQKITAEFRSKEAMPIAGLDLVATFDNQEKIEPVLSLINQAIQADKRLEINYVDTFGKETIRIVDPVALKIVNLEPLLDAYCHNAAAPRTFKLDKISSAKLIDSRRKIRSVDKFLELLTAQDNSAAVVATVTALREAKWVFEQLVDVDIAYAGDNLVATFPLFNSVWVCKQLLSVAFAVKEISPPQLANEFNQLRAVALSNYAS